MASNKWSQLSRAWVKDFAPAEGSGAVQRALQRTLPLLSEDPASVPFVCRYRADVIDPLTTKQVHQLSEYIQKHESLSSLRNKILEQLRQSDGDHTSTILRVETSISKSELDDIYAPFKPPSKGSLEDRIQKEHPELVAHVDRLWNERGVSNPDKELLRRCKPQEKAVILLANRIAADVKVMDALMDYCRRQCRVQVKQASGEKQKKAAKGRSAASTFDTYYDFSNKVSNLYDHQVLAIRRGVDQKQLRLGFDIDDSRVEHILQISAFKKKQYHKMYQDAVQDAWTRLLRKRCTSRLWKEVSKRAEERSIEVFCDNLQKALLAPPASMGNRKALLALDPGFQAGIKCAVLSDEGKVVALETVKFMGGAKESGKKTLVSLLEKVRGASGGSNALVVLGNGHGTREARQLVQEAAAAGSIEIDVRLVTEAGASVWSVTEMAKEEFPNETPAAIASVSIGRRWLNPLNELVKIPPRSMGLGMYQHDLPEKVLDSKLNATSIDAVAEVGVDVNSASAAILQKVPSLTAKLCGKIMEARPLRARSDLLKVSGLGPKTYENCAAFVRVSGGKEQLDSTLVHPESYDLAKWLLKELKWGLTDASSVASSDKEQREKAAKKAAGAFQVTQERALTVIDHLYFSIANPDPRLRKEAKSAAKVSTNGSAEGCSPLPAHLSTVESLRNSKMPVRNIIATVRNVVDFGAFVDIGLENDGLCHRSKMGGVQLQSLLVQ
ncbi:hypothetical protein ACHAXT_008607 [Thalassiosira profunda]